MWRSIGQSRVGDAGRYVTNQTYLEPVSRTPLLCSPLFKFVGDWVLVLPNTISTELFTSILCKQEGQILHTYMVPRLGFTFGPYWRLSFVY